MVLDVDVDADANVDDVAADCVRNAGVALFVAFSF